MMEQQVLEKTELADSIVRSSSCLLTFKTTYTDSNMRCTYHVHIISAITDCQGILVWVPRSHHSDNFSLLLRAYTTCKDYISTKT